MSILLYRLNDSSFDEAEEICELLETHELQYYQTLPGKWGFSVAAIWLINENQLGQARQLIEQYQSKRVTRIRAEYQQLKNEGKIETIFDRFKQHTLLFLMTLLMIVFIAYLSIKPFLSF